MAGITGILKNKKFRPWIIGGMVLVGVIVLFVMMRAKGAAGETAAASSGSSGPSEQLQAAQLQAQTSVNLAQIAANADMVRSTGEIEVALAGQQTSLAMAQYQVQSDQYTVAAQAGVQMAGIAAQQAIAQSQEQTAQYGIQAQTAVQTAGIQAQTAISEAQYKYLTDQSAINADVEKTRIGANQNVANKQSKNNLLGGIASTVGSLFAIFSDVRTKEDVTWTGDVDARRVGGRGFDSYGRSSWTYHGQDGISYGVIAQDVRHAAPGAVIQVRQSRFMAVDYAGLPG